MEDAFLNQPMMTMIGNKRKLVSNIFDIVLDLQKTFLNNKPKLNIVDAFTGSGVVSRAVSCVADTIYTNDLEYYSYIISRCFLEKPNPTQIEMIRYHIDTMNNLALNGPYYYDGFISRLYAPKDDNDIKEGERVFFTRKNGLIIDTLRKYISDFVEEDLFVYCVAPLLIKASIQNNTSGVFKGFHKKNGIGHFGGASENALSRILKPIELEMPIWSDHNFKAVCFNSDANQMVEGLEDDSVDIIYVDSPYNQHPYGSNYFMINLIATNKEPEKISSVSGIPMKWNKSEYNYKKRAAVSMKHLIDTGLKKAKYMIVSYNNEGIITDDEFNDMFSSYTVVKHEKKYDVYKGCKNLKERDNKVMEILYIITKK